MKSTKCTLFLKTILSVLFVFMILAYAGIVSKAADYPTITSIEATEEGIKITWNKLEGAANYAIMGKTANSTYKQLTSFTSENYTYLTYTTPGEYYLAVSALDDRYHKIGLIDPVGYYFKLLETADIENISMTDKGLVIKWNSVSGATSYDILRSKSNNAYTLLTSVDGSKTSFTDGYVRGKSTYSYKIIARGIGNAGALPSSSYYSEFQNTTVANYTVKFDQKEARKQLAMVNKFRTGKEAWAYTPSGKKDRASYKKLKKLKWDYNLEKAAMQRTAEIAYRFAHTRPNGTQCSTASEEIGYSGRDYYSNRYSGENIAYASWNIGSSYLIEMWKETKEPYSGQGHRRNMLSDVHTGFACAICHVGDFTFSAQEFSVTDNYGKKSKANNKTKTVKVNTEYKYAKSNKATVNGDDVSFKTTLPGSTKVVSAEHNNGTLILSWNRSTLTDGYLIQISKTKSGKYKTVKTIKNPDTLNAELKGFKKGDTLYIKVVPYRKNYNGKKLTPDSISPFKFKIK